MNNAVLRAIADRVKRQTTNPDVLSLCDAVLELARPRVASIDCPICVARRAAKAESQRKWREKNNG